MDQRIKNTIDNLNKRGFLAEYAEDAAAAKERVMELIKGAESIGMGGSVTIFKAGIQDAVVEAGYTVYSAAYAAKMGEDPAKAMKMGVMADVYMCSSNAITEDGTLLNIDGTGNRAAGLIYGPDKIIVVAGKNKLAADEASAMEHIKTVACPLNGKRLKKQLPCALTGKCNDCRSADRMCRVTIKHEAPTRNKEFHVIIVGEELGY